MVVLRGAGVGIVTGLVLGALASVVGVTVAVVTSAPEDEALAAGWGVVLAVVGTVFLTIAGGVAGAGAGLVADHTSSSRSVDAARRLGAVTYGVLLGLVGLLVTPAIGPLARLLLTVFMGGVGYAVMLRAMRVVLPVGRPAPDDAVPPSGWEVAAGTAEPRATSGWKRALVVLGSGFVGFWVAAFLAGSVAAFLGAVAGAALAAIAAARTTAKG